MSQIRAADGAEYVCCATFYGDSICQLAMQLVLCGCGLAGAARAVHGKMLRGITSNLENPRVGVIFAALSYQSRPDDLLELGFSQFLQPLLLCQRVEVFSLEFIAGLIVGRDQPPDIVHDVAHCIGVAGRPGGLSLPPA